MSRTSSTITVMFTDLVGSTELLRQGPDVADELQRAHRDSAQAAVENHRGTVVKGVGDGVMAVFSSATDAIACAEAVQRASDRARRADARHPLVRVGISAGEAIYDDESRDWYGQPVIEAARLCASDAESDGRVVITGVVRLLVGSAHPYTFEPLGARLLKGFDDPVECYELVRTQVAPSPIPLPTTVARASRNALIGRADAWSRLEQWWEAVQRDREPRVALLAGEPGMGKTRLVAELASRAHQQGAVVLWGGCEEELAAPYRPFTEALRAWLASASETDVRCVVRHPEVARLLPEVCDRFPELTPDKVEPAVSEAEAERMRLFDDVTNLLAGIADAQPALLVVDDLHWATTATLLLFRYIVEHIDAPLMLVGTYRDTEVHDSPSLVATLADLRRLDSVARVTLRGLDDNEVREFIATAEGDVSGGRDAIAEALRAETGGNPFFLGEVLRHLAERDLTAGTHASAMPPDTTTLGLPEGVREVIARRLLRLSEPANGLLKAAAVAGNEFDLMTLEAVARRRDDAAFDVLDELDTAVRARLIDEVEAPAARYAFTHALIRQTLLSDLTFARKARIHRDLAEVLQLQPRPDATALANHYCAAASIGATTEAIEWSLIAAWAAISRLAFEEALALLERAARVVDPTHAPARALAELHIELGRIRQSLGDVEGSKRESAQAAVEARRAGDPLLFATATCDHISWGMVATPDPEGRAMLREALAWLPDEHVDLRALLVAASAFYRSVYESAGAEANAEACEAIELARRAGNPIVLRETLATRALILMGTPDLETQRGLVREIAALEGEMPTAAHRMFLRTATLRQHVVIEMQAGNADLARVAAAEFRDIHQSAQGAGTAAFTTMWAGMFHLMAGELREAEVTIDELGKVADVNFANSWAAQFALLREEQGRLDELASLIDAAVAATPGLVALQTLRARITALRGDLEGASGTLRALTRDDLAALPRDATWSASMANLTEVAALTGDREPAAALHARLLPYEGQMLVVAWGVACVGAVDRYLGMLETVIGQHAAADAHFRAALALEGRADAPVSAARTQLWWARLKHTSTPADVDAIRALVATATATANRLELPGLAAQAAAVGAAI